MVHVCQAPCQFLHLATPGTISFATKRATGSLHDIDDENDNRVLAMTAKWCSRPGRATVRGEATLLQRQPLHGIKSRTRQGYTTANTCPPWCRASPAWAYKRIALRPSKRTRQWMQRHGGFHVWLTFRCPIQWRPHNGGIRNIGCADTARYPCVWPHRHNAIGITTGCGLNQETPSGQFTCSSMVLLNCPERHAKIHNPNYNYRSCLKMRVSATNLCCAASLIARMARASRTPDRSVLLTKAHGGNTEQQGNTFTARHRPRCTFGHGKHLMTRQYDALSDTEQHTLGDVNHDI